MADAKRERKKFITPVGRLTFPSLFQKAKPMEGSVSEPQYEATIVFDEAAIKKDPKERALFDAIRREMEACCLDKFKKSIRDARAKIGAFHDPLRNGEEKEHLDGYGAGTLFLKAKTKRRPGVITAAKVAIEDPEAVYSGCYVRFNVTPFAYDKGGGKGLSLALNSVLFVRDGDRLDGVSNAEEDFGEMAAEGDEGGEDSLM